MHLQVKFFRQESGKEPVRDWLKSVSAEYRKFIGEDIKTVQWGWPLGMPLVRNLGDGLWEIRTGLRGQIARILFCTRDGQIVLLHGLIKKTQAIPNRDLELARDRMKRLCGNKMSNKKINPHIGSDFDGFLEEVGILHEVEIVAAKRVIAWQIADIMETEGISKTAMASRMGTSRAVLDRLLDPENTGVTLKTLGKAATVLGRKININLAS
jgi:phage-related protein